MKHDKPDFVSPAGARDGIHSSRPARASLPAETGCSYTRDQWAGRPIPYSPCTGLGLSCLFGCPPSGGLLLPLFTLIPRSRDGLFSATLSVAAGFPATPFFSKGILPCGVRTFLSLARTNQARKRMPVLQRSAFKKAFPHWVGNLHRKGKYGLSSFLQILPVADGDR